MDGWMDGWRAWMDAWIERIGLLVRELLCYAMLCQYIFGCWFWVGFWIFGLGFF